MIPPRPSSSHAAFSLVELLAVLAILALLMSMLTPAVNSLGKTRELDTRSFQIAELVQMARQNAMTKNAMTALVVPMDPALSSNGRLAALFELPSAASTAAPSEWRQFTRWTELGDSVVIANCLDSAPSLTTPLPAMEHAGQKVSSWKTLVFMPDGSLLNAQASMRLATGYYPPNSSTPVFTGKMNSQSQPVDVCEITILPATGKVKIDRL